MKIFVNNIPHKPEECLFAVKEKMTTVYNPNTGSGQIVYDYRCNVNGKTCDLKYGKNCNKLRCIF